MERLTGRPLSPHFVAGTTPHALIISNETPSFLLCGWIVTWENIDPIPGDMCVICVGGKPYLGRYEGTGEVVLNCPHWEGMPSRLVKPDSILGRVVSQSL